MKTLNELISKALDIFPFAIVDEDSNGEIIISTGLKTDENDNLVQF